MSDKTIEAIIASPPEREELVVQLFVKDGGQWGEVLREEDAYILELYQPSGSEVHQIPVDQLSAHVLRPLLHSLGWLSVNTEEALHVVDLAVKELTTRQS